MKAGNSASFTNSQSYTLKYSLSIPCIYVVFCVNSPPLQFSKQINSPILRPTWPLCRGTLVSVLHRATIAGQQVEAYTARHPALSLHVSIQW